MAANSWLAIFTKMPEHARRLIGSIEIEKLYEFDRGSKVPVGTLHKIKLPSRVSAFEMLGRHLKMFTDRMEHLGKDGKPINHEITILDWRDEMLRRMEAREAELDAKGITNHYADEDEGTANGNAPVEGHEVSTNGTGPGSTTTG